MLRAIILSLILFVAFGTLVPIATEFSEASVKTQKRKYKKKKRARKYRNQARRKRIRSRQARKKRKLMSDSAWRRFTAKRRARARAKKRRAVAKRKRRISASKRRARAKSRKRTRSRRSVRKRSSKRRYTAKKRKRSVRRKRARRAVARKTRRVVRRKRVRKYSKKWWANHRAAQRRKKAVAKRKRSMRLRQMRLAKKKAVTDTPASARYSRIKTAPNQVRTKVQSDSVMPVQQVATGDLSVDVFGAATGDTVTKGRNTLLGGVSTTTLRRTVIDQMIRDSGWVENDYHKEIAGKKVYVVVAKAPDKDNRVQSRTYYFTESNGRIYRVATRSSQNADDSARKRSEEAIRSLDNAARPQQARNE